MRKHLVFLCALSVLTLIFLTACGYDSTLTGEENGQFLECAMKDDCIKKITVRDGEGGNALFSAAIDSAYVTTGLEGAVILADMNFDTHPDLLVRTSAVEEEARYDVFLWQESRRTYMKNTLLSSFYNPVADAGSGEITGLAESLTHEDRVDDEGEEYTVYTYERMQIKARYEGASLIPFYKEGVRYYSESDIYCYVVLEQNDRGKLEETREVWLRPDQFKKSAYATLMPTLPQ